MRTAAGRSFAAFDALPSAPATRPTAAPAGTSDALIDHLLAFEAAMAEQRLPPDVSSGLRQSFLRQLKGGPAAAAPGAAAGTYGPSPLAFQPGVPIGLRLFEESMAKAKGTPEGA